MPIPVVSNSTPNTRNTAPPTNWAWHSNTSDQRLSGALRRPVWPARFFAKSEKKKKERKQNSKREENIRFKKWAEEYLDKKMNELKEKDLIEKIESIKNGKY